MAQKTPEKVFLYIISLYVYWVTITLNKLLAVGAPTGIVFNVNGLTIHRLLQIIVFRS